MRAKHPALKVVVVDIHAEASSEKQAIGWWFDGRASAVIGSHTHVPTADARILPKGTAYLGDAGMTGAYEGIIGFDPKNILEKFPATRRRAPWRPPRATSASAARSSTSTRRPGRPARSRRSRKRWR